MVVLLLAVAIFVQGLAVHHLRKIDHGIRGLDSAGVISLGIAAFLMGSYSNRRQLHIVPLPLRGVAVLVRVLAHGSASPRVVVGVNHLFFD